jgi:cytoskeletal protein CcmA (bactofilin family)
MSKRSGSSFIESDVQMLGDLSFSGEFYLSGKVTGNIVAPTGSDATLYIQADSVVDGEIRVPNVIVSGCIIGDIFAEKRLEVATHAKITGNVHYMLLKIDLGAEVNGRLARLKNTT